MKKLQTSLRTIVLIGVAIVMILVIVTMVNYDSFIHSILALLDGLKSGR